MWLWLDDVRPVPPGWVGAHSVNEAIALLRTGDVEYASLDHDLGAYAADGGDAVKLTDWMAEHAVWPTRGVRIHSSNPVGVATMLTTIDTYGPYPVRGGNARGTWTDPVLDSLAPPSSKPHRRAPGATTDPSHELKGAAT